jgi:hypothetical protein
MTGFELGGFYFVCFIFIFLCWIFYLNIPIVFRGKVCCDLKDPILNHFKELLKASYVGLPLVVVQFAQIVKSEGMSLGYFVDSVCIGSKQLLLFCFVYFSSVLHAFLLTRCCLHDFSRIFCLGGLPVYHKDNA